MVASTDSPRSSSDTVRAALIDNQDGEAGPDAQPLEIEDPMRDTLTPTQARAFFLSHALSTWNARTYEFAAIIYTASAFPDSLAMSSLRGLITTSSALLLSTAIGRAIDQAQSRLTPLMASILVNRVSIAAACVAWYALFSLDVIAVGQYSGLRLTLFGTAMLFGIIEKLSGIGNMVASERDWVPNMADQHGPYTLSNLNAICRRIDLSCKLLAPVAISWAISASTVRIGILVVGALSIFSCSIESWNALRVWHTTEKLRMPKLHPIDAEPVAANGCLLLRLRHAIRAQVDGVTFYFSTSIWVPSFALALIYISALSYAATLTTYLLNTGFSLMMITIARTGGSVIEVSSTYIAPAGIRHLAEARHHKRDVDSDELDELQAGDSDSNNHSVAKHAIGLQRSALWGVTLQWVALVPVVIALWQLEGMGKAPEAADSTVERFIRGLAPTLSWVMTSIVMFLFLSISRMGVWVFDMAVQEITQTGVEASRRSSFAGTETALVNFFELAQWAVSLAFPRTEQFKWLALGSLAAVTCSMVACGLWVRTQRGHLFHLERIASASSCCMKPGQ